MRIRTTITTTIETWNGAELTTVSTTETKSVGDNPAFVRLEATEVIKGPLADRHIDQLQAGVVGAEQAAVSR